jgi:hypothetical protein
MVGVAEKCGIVDSQLVSRLITRYFYSILFPYKLLGRSRHGLNIRRVQISMKQALQPSSNLRVMGMSPRMRRRPFITVQMHTIPALTSPRELSMYLISSAVDDI